MSLGAQSFASSGVKGFFGISRDFIHVQNHSLIPINFIGRLCPITVKILFDTDQSPNKYDLQLWIIINSLYPSELAFTG